MDSQLSLRLSELLTSRLCHDLITPIGAIQTGFELYREIPSSHLTDSQEILNLILQNTQSASARISFFRIAFGSSGAKTSLEEAKELIQNYFLRSKLEFHWKEPFQKDFSVQGWGRLLLNAVLWIGDSAPRGGKIAISTPREGHPHLSISLHTDLIVIHQGALEALKGQGFLQELTPRIAPCYLIHSLSTALNGQLSIHHQPSPAELLLEIRAE